jgi:hypothetical protein
MDGEIIYNEKVTSPKTQALFLALTGLFAWLYSWRRKARRRDLLSDVAFFFTIFFLFYSINYRTLRIRITSQELRLRFGIFTWNVPVEDIASCELDHLPPVMRMGGAGIHFMMIRNRYRASLNFLEYPRVVIGLKRKLGPVQDISFTTRHPEQVVQLIREAMAESVRTYALQ